MKRTIIVAGGTAAAAMRLHAARQNWLGVEIRTAEQVAARLAGGFLQPIDSDVLMQAASVAIAGVPPFELGDLAEIADLPGLSAALAATLSKAWHAGIDLAERAASRPDMPRLTALARLETAILEYLPGNMLRPAELVARAIARSDHIPAVFGSIELAPMLDLSPCWRPLLAALNSGGSLQWQAGAYQVPGWWTARHGGVHERPSHAPHFRVVTCATAHHEVIEAMRWARSLLATGVQAQRIAFAAASPGEYDDLVFSMSEEANLPVHFAHGRRALTTRDGHAAAALADLLINGLSQDRVRRLARLAHAEGTPFGRLPGGWEHHLPQAAPLGSPERWRQALASGEAGADITEVLLPAMDLLGGGTDCAQQAGEIFLRGSARLLWHRALARAPASALEASLGGMRLPDGVEPATSLAWMHASALATCPRPYVWLLGLNARTWPRASREDPLLPDHIIPSSELDPLPVTRMDRLAYRAICATTEKQLVCSASRRDATGRVLGLSPLLPPGEPERLRRARVPSHAMSEQDRMMARPGEFATTPRAQSAMSCWQDWNNPGITAHDGLVRPDHPVLERAMARVHSASSLRMLLRNPLGFTWQYALGWKEPDHAAESMDLDPMQFGNLVHEILQTVLPAVEAAGGIGRAAASDIAAAVADACRAVAARWEAEQPVPPALLWKLRRRAAEEMATAALSWPLPAYRGQISYGEVVFGEADTPPGGAPWNSATPVTIPGTNLQIRGRIDRLDLSADGTQARVVDYKTGKPRDPGELNGGAELQRCLYAWAVQALLGAHVTVEAALLYPRGEAESYFPLSDAGATLTTLATALLRARENLRTGQALPGPDTGDTYDPCAFALPASPTALTERKKLAAKELLGEAAAIWEHA